MGGNNVLVGKALDLHSLQALVGVLDESREALQIETRRLDNVPVVIRVPHEAGERILEQIQVSSRPLNVRERLRVRRLEKVKELSAHERKSGKPN